MSLYELHLKDLHASGLSDSTIEIMEVYSLESRLVMGMSEPMMVRTDSALIFPYFDSRGQKTNFIRAKLFPPYKGKNGTQKYWQASGSKNHLYILPPVNGVLKDPTKELYIVEGEKKTAKATQTGLTAIGLGGLWNWKEKTEGLLKEFDLINWADRQTIIVPDSDVWSREDHNLRLAVYLLSRQLEDRGANVYIKKLEGKEKTGLDDFLVTHPLEEFFLLPKLLINEAFSEEEIQRFEVNRNNQQDAESIPLIGGRRRDDIGNGERFVDQHGKITRWSQQLGWLYYNGKYWQENSDRSIEHMAEGVARSIFIEAARTRDKEEAEKLGAWAIKSSSMAGIKNMLESAKNKPGMAVQPDIFNSNNSLLNLQNGTLNLDTGEFYNHRKEDFLTKIANVEYDREAKCPLWREQLNRFVPSMEDRQFLQRAVGYSLSGDISNHCFFILYGEGSNGKSTFIETVFDVMGNYAGKIQVDTIIEQPTIGIAIESDLASLHGVRLALASEPNARKKLNTSIIKQMTSDIMRAKWYHNNRFSFRTTHKLWIETNHKLTIPDDDDGTWRRLKQLPWIVKIQESEMILHFKEKLKTEYSGILNWLIDGYAIWKIMSIGESPNSKKEKETYRKDEDIVHFFLKETHKITHNPNDEITKDKLLEFYLDWCKKNSVRPMSTKSLYPRLRKKGLGESMTDGIRSWTGIRLRTPQDPQDEE